MADNNILAQATTNPALEQSKATGGTPNPFLRAMNQETKTDISILSDGQVGTFLQRRSIVNGDIATIINASLDYFLGDKNESVPPINPAFKLTSARKSFIPIIMKTDFVYNVNNTPGGVKTPLYIIFDSTPDKIAFNKTANWVAKDFLGRPEPVWTYAQSGATTFSLTGKFFAESFKSHGRLLKLSDYIMSLVTPSQTNYMPSPITLFIGEWKKLRCIVNQITITYEGPWKVNVDLADVESPTATKAEAEIRRAAMVIDGGSSIASHAPYMFEAAFALTVVHKDNDVNYAEQVVFAGDNSSAELDSVDKSNIKLQSGLQSDEGPPTSISGLYNLQDGVNYVYYNGQIRREVVRNLTYTTAAENLNLYADSNDARRLADQGAISNAVSSQMLTMFQKAKPSSTNTSPINKSLDPFKKLF